MKKFEQINHNSFTRTWKKKEVFYRSEYALRVLCDIWLNGIYDQWLRMHGIIWTQMGIMKVGLKIMTIVLYNTWRKKKWTEKNLPPGWVLQGNSEQGMPSLLLLPENEELATASCWSNLYPKHMSASSINSTYKTTHFRWTWRWFITCRLWHIWNEKRICTV